MEKEALIDWLNKPANQNKVIGFITKQINGCNINDFLTKEEKLIKRYITLDYTGEDKWVSPTILKLTLEQLYKRKLHVVPIGKALNKLGITKKKSMGRSYYLIQQNTVL